MEGVWSGWSLCQRPSAYILSGRAKILGSTLWITALCFWQNPVPQRFHCHCCIKLSSGSAEVSVAELQLATTGAGWDPRKKGPVGVTFPSLTIPICALCWSISWGQEMIISLWSFFLLSYGRATSDQNPACLRKEKHLMGIFNGSFYSQLRVYGSLRDRNCDIFQLLRSFR